MQSVLGEELPEVDDELPISLSVAFERLRQIRSFYYFLVGMAALGFALFSAPLFLSLYFDEDLGLDAFQRGVVGTIIAFPTLIAIAIAGRRADALFRKSPPAAMAFVGFLVALFGVLLVVAISMPNIWTVVPVLAVATALRPSRVRDPPCRGVDDHPVPPSGPGHRDDRRLRLPVRRRSSERCSPAC